MSQPDSPCDLSLHKGEGHRREGRGWEGGEKEGGRGRDQGGERESVGGKGRVGRGASVSGTRLSVETRQRDKKKMPGLLLYCPWTDFLKWSKLRRKVIEQVKKMKDY